MEDQWTVASANIQTRTNTHRPTLVLPTYNRHNKTASTMTKEVSKTTETQMTITCFQTTKEGTKESRMPQLTNLQFSLTKTVKRTICKIRPGQWTYHNYPTICLLPQVCQRWRQFRFPRKREVESILQTSVNITYFVFDYLRCGDGGLVGWW